MVDFTQTAEEYEAEREMQSNDVWIRKFPPGKSQHRFVEELAGRPTWREHNYPVFGWGPCPPPSSGLPCPGCASQDEKIRKRNRFWGINALDAQGRLVPRKMGKTLLEALKEQMDLLGVPTITDRDYIISRKNTGLDTTYTPFAKEKYDIPFPPPEELYDIKAIINGRYEQLVQAFGLTEQPEPGDTAPAERPAAAAAPEQPVGGRITPKYGRPQSSDEAQANAAPDPAPDPEKVADWNITKLRAFLDGQNHLEAKIEYPSRAQRTTLVGIVEAWLEENPPPAF